MLLICPTFEGDIVLYTPRVCGCSYGGIFLKTKCFGSLEYFA